MNSKEEAKTIAILEGAIGLLSDVSFPFIPLPSHDLAIDQHGRAVNPKSDRAIQWSLLGALYRSSQDWEDGAMARGYIKEAGRKIYPHIDRSDGLATFGALFSRDEILRTLREAIAICKRLNRPFSVYLASLRSTLPVGH